MLPLLCFQDALMSIADQPLPHQVPAARATAMKDSHEKNIHTDSLRGVTLQSIQSEGPGYGLEVFPYPEYCSSVLRDKRDGEFYIPTDRMGDHVAMIGYGRGCLWERACQGRVRSSVTNHLFPAEVLDECMEPVGPTPCIVAGVRKLEGSDDAVPICLPRFDAERLHEIDELDSSTKFREVPFRELVDYAVQHAYHEDPRCLPSIVLGTVPHVWYWFAGWMHSHRLLRGGDVGRGGMHFRAVGTPITAANLMLDSRSSRDENWVDRRLTLCVWERVVLRLCGAMG